jgi:hypothetical protein
VAGVAFHSGQAVVLTRGGDNKVRVHGIRDGQSIGVPCGGNMSTIGCAIGRVSAGNGVVVLGQDGIRL